MNVMEGGKLPPKLCPFCRKNPATEGGTGICEDCLTKSKVAKVDQLVEKSAIEIMAQLTRFVVRKAMTLEDASKLSWDMAIAFVKAGLERKRG